MCEKKGLNIFLSLGFILYANKPATDSCCGSSVVLGRTIGMTVTAKIQGEGEELNMRAVFIEGGGRRRQEERGLGGRSALV